MKPRSLSNGILRVLFSAVLLLMTAAVAFAQENTGAVQGTIDLISFADMIEVDEGRL